MQDVRHGDASPDNPMSSNQSECENGLTTVNREGRWYKLKEKRMFRCRKASDRANNVLKDS